MSKPKRVLMGFQISNELREKMRAHPICQRDGESQFVRDAIRSYLISLGCDVPPELSNSSTPTAPFAFQDDVIAYHPSPHLTPEAREALRSITNELVKAVETIIANQPAIPTPTPGPRTPGAPKTNTKAPTPDAVAHNPKGRTRSGGVKPAPPEGK